jgi:hypothetical protein
LTAAALNPLTPKGIHVTASQDAKLAPGGSPA